ncbi:hypothetical protein ACQUSY_06020 [Microbacterium sp. YY-03]|uniref:hypothetical protein n=1 Tax=Microbacterium sp. YY-03 TaxID=3421636 RepID=UPI003D178BA9
MYRPSHALTVGVLIAAGMMVLAGCSGQQAPDTIATPAPTASTPTPTYDAEKDMWLQNGWPVPDPDATFDPNAPWLTASEVQAIVQSCLSDEGWDLELNTRGGLQTNIPDGQYDAFHNTLRECYVKNRIGTAAPAPLNKELATREYAAQIATRDCLIGLGIDVPEFPSYTVYEDDLLVNGFVNSIYTVADAAGIDLYSDPIYQQTCPDPADSFGHN